MRTNASLLGDAVALLVAPQIDLPYIGADSRSSVIQLSWPEKTAKVRSNLTF